MIKPLYFVLSLSAAIMLSACQQESAPPGSTAPVSASTSQAAVNPAITNPLFSVEPATIAACDPAATATVKWDVRNAHSDLKSVAIWAGAGSSAKLFASGGASGEATTGPWVRPGSMFELKNPSTGEVLGQIKVGGPACP